MGFDLDIFSDERLEADFVGWLVDEQSVNIQRHFGRKECSLFSVIGAELLFVFCP